MAQARTARKVAGKTEPKTQVGTSSRPSWRGSIAFGMVSIPVRLHVATEERAVRFNQLHDADGGRIKMVKTCADCENVLGPEEIVRGFQWVKDEYVRVTDEDFAALPVASKQVIDVVRFVNSEAVDPLYLSGKHYYVSPDEAGERGYALLYKAMSTRDKAGIAKIAFRSEREHLVSVRALPEGLVLETLHWADEIRVPTFEVPTKVAKEELAVALQLVDSLSGDFDVASFRDEYREQLMARIEAKVNNKPLPKAKAVKEMPARDLMDALKRSVDANKKARKSA